MYGPDTLAIRVLAPAFFGQPVTFSNWSGYARDTGIGTHSYFHSTCDKRRFVYARDMGIRKNNKEISGKISEIFLLSLKSNFVLSMYRLEDKKEDEKLSGGV